MEEKNETTIRNTTGAGCFSELMTEDELVDFLRIPVVSSATNYGHVIENLKRMHDLPCIHICKKPLYPLNAVREWIDNKLMKEQR